LAVLLLTVPAAPLRGAEANFTTEIQPLLAKFCLDCHSGKGGEAGVDLAAFADDTSVLFNKKLWRRVLSQLDSGTMPPAEETQPSAAERKALADYVNEALTRPIPFDPAARDPGRSIIRRLTRTEYNNTVRDLFGIETDIAAAVGMPDESVSEGFDNVAEALQLQAVQMEKYFAAAQRTVDTFLTPIADDPQREARRVAALERLFSAKQAAGQSQPQAAREIMLAFLPRAFRRPVDGIEVERYLKVYDAAGGSRRPLEEGVRVMLEAALVSPNFLLRIEENRAPQGSRAPYAVSDYELASRLSYFLWASMPDDALFALAAEQKLSQPEVLQAQVHRMLADPKARALTDNFAAQWLQLRRLPTARPSIEFFPTLTPALRDAMYEETALLFDDIRRRNLSVVTLLDADYTFVNGPLAEHYGWPGIEGEEFRRVKLKQNDVRGGLLGMASILTINSHTFRTSPTMRGKWILEVILGTPPPPPPANVSQISEEADQDAEVKNFRELLARHAKDAECAACHKKIDPLGFGLENFDAVGRYREKHGGEPIDAGGELPGGEKFRGPQELRRVVLARQEPFVQHLTEQMLAYALGRKLEYHDQIEVERILGELKSHNNRFETLVQGIVASYPFRHRRNLDPQEVNRPR
jgi:hypothetical protein